MANGTNIDFVDLSATVGLVATSLLTVNLLLGILVTMKYRRMRWWNALPARIKAIDLFIVHNYTAYLGLAVAVVHPVLLLFDAKAGFTIRTLLAPWLAPHQSLFYCLGALSLWALAVVTFTSMDWARKRLPNRIWKGIHFAAYAAAPLFLIHGLIVDQHLTDKPPDLLDGEKLLSLGGLVLLAAAVAFRFRFEISQAFRSSRFRVSGSEPDATP